MIEQTLSDLMQVDHVIRVNKDGTIEDDIPDVWAPEFTVETDEDGQILAEHDKAMIEEINHQGWQVLNGWSGQYQYSGPIMHRSEFVGGGLEAHIRETPGLYCVVTVETDDDDDEAAGWLICYRDEEDKDEE